MRSSEIYVDELAPKVMRIQKCGIKLNLKEQIIIDLHAASLDEA